MLEQMLIVSQILATSYGLSNWPVPTVAAVLGPVATQMGDVNQATWYTSMYVVAATIAFMICGANSDLFGRRWQD